MDMVTPAEPTVEEVRTYTPEELKAAVLAALGDGFVASGIKPF